MKTKHMFMLVGISGLITAATCGCNPNSQPQVASEGAQPVAEAQAAMEPTEGNTVRGMVTFAQAETGVRVVADLTGLKPGEHGIHIHEHGDCSAPDGSSAGGHFNPTGMSHGGPEAAQHHVGDLGNITADASGTAKMDRVFSFLDLNGANTIVGRGLIVHSDRDDLTSQPTGNAGKRVACGVIEATD